MDNVKTNMTLAKEMVELLPNEEAKTTAQKSVDGIEAAIEMADSNEKKAYLVYASTQVVDNITFALFRENLLTAEKIEAYYSLPIHGREAYENYKHYEDGRKKAEQELLAQRDKQYQREKEFDIFVSVARGVKKEDAEARQAEYEQRLAQATGEKA